MKTKHILLSVISVVAVICTGVLSTAREAEFCSLTPWTSREAKPFPPPNADREIAADASWKILPKEDVYEVGVSKMDWSSVRDLPPSGCRKLSTSEAKSHIGAYYSYSPGKTPYLIRAVYRTGNGPGHFRAERKGDSVAIVFGDVPKLPPKTAKYEWSAVVVNLDFTPDSVYTTISGFQ